MDQRLLPSVEQVLRGEPSFYQGPYRTMSSGREVLAVMHAKPIRDAQGRVIGGVGFVEDATERLAVEEELRRQLQVIQEQSDTIHSLATPILKVWTGVLCMPIIGAVGAERIAEMTETMLRAITDESARFAILDLTGVDMVDTRTASYLMRLAQSAQLVGAEAVVCGLRPAVAQTLVTIGADIGAMHTMRSMHEALRFCLAKLDDER